ncbi:MAG: hypothetical protein RIC16_00805 [Rhodospirillales bacterium]
MRALILMFAGLGLVWLSMPSDGFAAGNCGRLVRAQGQDVIVNTCGTCQNIHIVRSRGGGGLPDVRTFRIEAKSRLDLPFKGFGSTRITGSDECAPESAEQKRIDREVAKANAECVLTGQLAAGYLLVNRCTACRQTIVRWVYENGGQKNLPVKIDARSSVNVPRGTEIGLNVVHEEPCSG